MLTSIYKTYVSPSDYKLIKEYLESDSGLTDKPSSTEDPWEDSGTSTPSGESETTQPTKSSSKTVMQTDSSTIVSKNGQLYEIPKPIKTQAYYTPVTTKHDPAHYKRGSIEVWDFIVDQQLDYLAGNCVKYICRAGHKDKESELDDWLKVKAYVERKIQQLSQ
jgi:hypothetical protein